MAAATRLDVDTKNGKAPLAAARKAHPTTGITTPICHACHGVVRLYQIDVSASSVRTGAIVRWTWRGNAI